MMKSTFRQSPIPVSVFLPSLASLIPDSPVTRALLHQSSLPFASLSPLMRRHRDGGAHSPDSELRLPENSQWRTRIPTLSNRSPTAPVVHRMAFPPATNRHSRVRDEPGDLRGGTVNILPDSDCAPAMLSPKKINRRRDNEVRGGQVKGRRRDEDL
jgi:hypothetical protein